MWEGSLVARHRVHAEVRHLGRVGGGEGFRTDGSAAAAAPPPPPPARAKHNGKKRGGGGGARCPGRAGRHESRTRRPPTQHLDCVEKQRVASHVAGATVSRQPLQVAGEGGRTSKCSRGAAQAPPGRQWEQRASVQQQRWLGSVAAKEQARGGRGGPCCVRGGRATQPPQLQQQYGDPRAHSQKSGPARPCGSNTGTRDECGRSQAACAPHQCPHCLQGEHSAGGATDGASWRPCAPHVARRLHRTSHKLHCRCRRSRRLARSPRLTHSSGRKSWRGCRRGLPRLGPRCARCSAGTAPETAGRQGGPSSGGQFGDARCGLLLRRACRTWDLPLPAAGRLPEPHAYPSIGIQAAPTPLAHPTPMRLLVCDVNCVVLLPAAELGIFKCQLRAQFVPVCGGGVRVV